MILALRRPLVAVPLTVLTALLVLLILSAVRVHEMSDAVERQSREAMNWSASQMEVEFWRLAQAVGRQENTVSPKTLEEISLRIDILWSRMRLFQSGEMGVRLAGLPDIRRLVDRLDIELRTIDRIFHEYSAQVALGVEIPRAELEGRLAPQFEAAAPLLRDLALEANVVGAKRWEELVARHRSLVTELIGLLGGVFLLGLVLLVILARQLREARQREGSEKMEAVGRLAGGVSHEINNVLAIVSGFTEMAQKAAEAGQPVDKHLDRIGQAALRGQRIAQDLLAFGRKSVGKDAVFDLRDLLIQQEQLLLPLLGERVRLDLSVPNDPLPVQGDADLMGQVVMNLAINARDAMPDGGTIALQATRKGSHAILVVKDQGIGMDARTVRRIFEPFFTTKGPGKGTGLGLSIVYGAIHRIGGKIKVASEVGKGTTFTLTLNRAAHGHARCQAAAPLPVNSGGVILVAEDEPDLLHLMENTLASLGYRVLTASSGEEALAVQARHDGPIHVLLSDIVMPGIHGTELAQRIRAIRPETRVVLMTGFPGRDIGTGDIKNEKILQKPVDTAELARVLAAAVGEARRVPPGLGSGQAATVPRLGHGAE